VKKKDRGVAPSRDPLTDGTDWGRILWILEAPDDPRDWADVPLRERFIFATRALEILTAPSPEDGSEATRGGQECSSRDEKNQGEGA
jgi:hypothetical protein